MIKIRIALGVLIPVALAVAGFLWLRTPVHRPNILLITIDSLRADHLGTYGYSRPTSPNIDALARSSVVFDNAFTQATLSAPSHVTILTSVHTPAHGVVNNGLGQGRRLNLPEVLRSSGYETGMFVSHPLVSKEFGLGRGFDVSRNHTVHSHGPDHRHRDDVEEREPPFAVIDDALGWMTRARPGPFFVWLHLQHVHKSYEPPPPYDTMFGEKPSGSPYDLRCLNTLAAHQEGKITMSREQQDYVVALYDGEIAWVDTELDRFFETLREADLHENTIVILTSDHGEMLFDDPERRITGHGRHRSDVVLRVPLIVQDPRKPANGRRIDSMVGLIDLAPTVLDLAGIEAPDLFHGKSLVPLLEGREIVIRETTFSCTIHTDKVIRLAARTARLKLVCDRKVPAQTCKLYDLVDDPREQVNVIEDPRYGDEVRALETSLENWFFRTMRPGQENARQAHGERARELLRRAGYLPEVDEGSDLDDDDQP